MIERAVQYEADFFKIGSQFGTTIQVHLSGIKDVSFEYSIHPYHTCRRLYATVDHVTGVSMLKFELYYGGRGLIGSMPLSAFVEDYDPVELRMETIESIQPFAVAPHFLEALQGDKKLLSLLCLSMETMPDLADIPLSILELQEPKPWIRTLSSGSEFDVLEFADKPRFFPFAIDAARGTEEPPDRFETILEAALSPGFDRLSTVKIGQALTEIRSPGFIFSERMMRRAFFENRSDCLRTAILTHFTRENDLDVLLSLMPLALQPQYRQTSEQFLMCFEQFTDVTRDLFFPFYQDLEQFETAKTVDQTFISLLSLIPVNAQTVQLTYERLSVAPSVSRPNCPFVHSEPARKAAFRFVDCDLVFPYLLPQLHALPVFPLGKTQLSDDFTPKGRNGISNLGTTCYINALMQSLNTLTPFVNRILAQPTDVLSPFLFELRNFLAQLRFSRGGSVSIKRLADQIPNFDAFIQEDAEEFLTFLVTRVMEDLKENAINDEVVGSFEHLICSRDEVFSSSKEDFCVVSLQTKGMTSLTESFQKYFADDPIEGGYQVEGREGKVDAFLRRKISKWPRNFIIQLQRWDFELETGERIKLVHDFGFPTILGSSDVCSNSHDEFEYNLSAVICHIGDADSGHYIAIVKGDNDQWFYCDDDNISPFDIGTLPDCAFGIQDRDYEVANEARTAYLLFYRQEEGQGLPVQIPDDLKNDIDKMNATRWPSTFFFSSEFLVLAHELILANPGQEALTLSFFVYFRIVFVNQNWTAKWTDLLMNSLLTSEQSCEEFFRFLQRRVGSQLGDLIALSDFVLESVHDVISHVVRPAGANHIQMLLDALNFHEHRRSISLAFDLIALACDRLEIEWKEHDDLLRLIVEYLLVNDWPKEQLGQLRKTHTDVLDVFLKVLSEAVTLRNAAQLGQLIMSDSVLSRLANPLRKSNYFQVVCYKFKTIDPSVFSAIENPSPAVEKLISPFRPDQTEFNAGVVTIDSWFIEDSLLKLSFCDDQRIRARVSATLLRVLPKPPAHVEKFIRLRIVDSSLTRGAAVEGNSFLLLLLGLAKVGMATPQYFKEFTPVLLGLSVAAPFGTCQLMPVIEEFVLGLSDQGMLSEFMGIVRNMLAYEGSLVPRISVDVIDTFLRLDCGGDEAIQLISLFPERASGTQLMGSCVGRALDSRYSQHTELHIKLLKEGVHPGDFQVPERAKDPMNIQLAIVLFNVVAEQKDALANYMLDVIHGIRPIKVFANTQIYKDVSRLLMSYCPDRLKLIQHTRRSPPSPSVH
jgi:ubiquitin C-terminal hydrolase